MQTTIKSLLTPGPLIGISTTGLLLAATFSSLSSSKSPLSSSSATNNMSTTTNQSWSIKPYTPRHQTWPYTASDFTRQDSSPDTSFYSAPRFVTHIDDAAIASLRNYYASELPTQGRILDFCSSWISHYPAVIEGAASSSAQGTTTALRITGLGMNEAELAANPVLNNGRIVVDLNSDSDISQALQKAGSTGDSNDNDKELFDAATNVVSIDYLTQPVTVLQTLRKVTKPGGRVHLVISNRCFPTKAVGRWLRVSEDERLQMVGDYLHFAGWTEIEIVELSNGSVQGGDGSNANSLQGLMALLGGGGNSRDPLWVVRATNR